MSETNDAPEVPMISFAGLQIVDPTDMPKAKRKYERSAYAGDPQEVLEKLVVQRMKAYQVDALDAIHDLATMAISNNSAQNQVKLLACKILAFPDGQQAPSDGGLEGTLRALNDAYHKDAPRIRSIRERVVTFENDQQVVSTQE